MVNKPVITDIIIFGGYGDLSLKKLLPALYRLFTHNLLHKKSRIILIIRHNNTHAQHRKFIIKSLTTNINLTDNEERTLNLFLDMLYFVSFDISIAENYQKLYDLLATKSHKKIYYLSVAASLFGDVCRYLKDYSLTKNSSIVLEKPIGHNLQSFQEINLLVNAFFDKKNIFFIDHYLGKHSIQNIVFLRFTNPLLSMMWNRLFIDNVQITVAEKSGVDDRLGYYNQCGAILDMVQNHIMHLVCLIAMDQPLDLSSVNINKEKLRVIGAMENITSDNINNRVARGKYITKNHITVETFAAIKIHINNDRWDGVPFYLRTGKKMSREFSQIVINFKEFVHPMFRNNLGNQLVIDFKPMQNISLMINTKPMYLTNENNIIRTAIKLELGDDSKYIPDAYDRLLLDIINNDHTSFTNEEVIIASWKWIDNLLHALKQSNTTIHNYAPGEDGPMTAQQLIANDNRKWFDKYSITETNE